MRRKHLGGLVVGLMAAVLFTACGGELGEQDGSAEATGGEKAWVEPFNWGYNKTSSAITVYTGANLKYASGSVGSGEWFRIDAPGSGFYQITYNTLYGLKSGYVNSFYVGLGGGPGYAAWIRPTGTADVRAYASASAPVIGKVFTSDILLVFQPLEEPTPGEYWGHIQYQTSRGVKSGYLYWKSLP